MGTTYTIQCKKCGAHIHHFAQVNFGITNAATGCSDFVETEIAIRCPICHNRLNSTLEEFREQVKVSFLKD